MQNEFTKTQGLTLSATRLGVVPPELYESWNKIAQDTQKVFPTLLGNLSEHCQGNMDWWVSSPASRNPFTSPLFYYCCYLKLVADLLKENVPLVKISTDSPQLLKSLKILIKTANKNVVIEKKISPVIGWYSGLGLWKRLILLPIVVLGQYFRLRRILPPQLPEHSLNLTLIDTFVIQPSHIREDRYFPRIYDNLSNAEKTSVFWVPEITAACFSAENLKLFKQAEGKFLFKEHVLTCKDYLYAFGFIWRSRKLKLQTTLWQGIDIVGLVKEELARYYQFPASLQGLCNYRFVKGLKTKGIKVKLAIDWFENQIVDRGWNKGFRESYPESSCVGYQGFFVSPHYQCIYPSSQELENQVIPKQIAVMGSGLLSKMSQNLCQDGLPLEVIVAPALRFAELWQPRKIWPEAHPFRVLLCLPIVPEESLFLIDFFVCLKEVLSKDQFVLHIKNHPNLLLAEMQKMSNKPWPGDIEFVQGDFQTLVEGYHVLASNTSSVCMESLAKGVPVMVILNKIGLNHNPIPQDLDTRFWRECLSVEEGKAALENFKAQFPQMREALISFSEVVRRNYFSPTNRQTIAEFLHLPNEHIPNHKIK